MSEVTCSGSCENCSCEHEAEKMPPVGVIPYGYVASDRINDLLGAIGRYINDTPLTQEKVKTVKLWTVELNEQIDLLSTMLIYDT